MHGCAGCEWCSFICASRYLEHARDPMVGRPLANNTRLIRRSESEIAIRLHATDIVTLFSSGEVEFNTGGWDTVTTKERMNRVCNFSIYSERIPDASGSKRMESVWTARKGRWWAENTADRKPLYVFEGRTIRFDSKGYSAAPLFDRAYDEAKAKRQALMAERRALHGRIQAYTNRTMKALATGLPVEGEMPEDTNELRALIQRADEPSGPLTMRIIGRELPGDLREWLNFHERDGEVVMGNLAPIVEPIVRRKVRETLTRTLVR